MVAVANECGARHRYPAVRPHQPGNADDPQALARRPGGPGPAGRSGGRGAGSPAGRV